MGHVSAPEPTSEAGAIQSRRTRVSGGALLSGEAGFGAKGRVAASDPSWMARRGPEALGTWQRRSPPRRRRGARCRCGMWQRVDVCLAFCLGLKHVCGDTQSVGYRQGGSPTAGAPPTWLPPSPAGYWPLSGPAFWRPPPHPHPSQLGGTPHPQTGLGYWSSPMSLGSPLGGQVPPPFGSPSLRTPLL
jgi:hypothetical protein